MQIEHLLSATSAPLLDVLGERGRAYYVPMYQRRYRWTAGKIDRLLQDLIRGLDRIVYDKEALSFIGTLISSRKDETEDLGREPSKTLAIIDGQQRLTTFSLLCIACDDELTVRQEQDELDPEADYTPWLQGQIHRVRDDLWQCLCEDTRNRSDEIYRYRPRIIRSGDDQWGVTNAEAAYDSPLSRIAVDYITWRIQEGNNKSFVFSPDQHAERNPELRDQYNTLLKRFRNDIRRRLRRSLEDADEDLVLPRWHELGESRDWLDGLFESDSLDRETTAALIRDCREDEGLGAQVRLVLFSRFLVDRSVMTLVESQREDYALDMFDSLNTTGEPLTALETFKPRVIQGEGGVARYRASESFGHFDFIERYLAAEGPEHESTLAKSIVTIFALAETGQKLGGNLSEQRNFLRETYETISDQPAARRAMTRQLERTSALNLLVWDKTPEVRDPRLSGELRLPDEVIMYLDVLRKSQHEIVQGLLSRYYDTIISQRAPEALQRFAGATRALLGFWILWRASADGTRGIDTAHRDLMSRGIPPEGEPQLVAPLARIYGNELPSPDRLAAVLRERLASVRGIDGKSSFVENAREVPIGRARNLARFMVLAAHHGQTYSRTEPGLTQPARESAESDLLNLQAWTDDGRYVTLEHISPVQPKRDEDVDQQLYVGDRHELLGNLAALPLDLNSMLSNRSWPVKRTVFSALAADDSDEAKEILERSGYEFAEETIELVADKSAVIPTLRPLLNVEDWNLELVERRTQHMLENVWAHASSWLGFGSDESGG